MSNKKLMLSNDKVFAGVCGGLAEYFNFTPTFVRLIYFLATIALCDPIWIAECRGTGFSGVLIYLLLWAIMPRS